MVFFWVLSSVVFISVLSLVGVLSLSVGKRRLHNFLTLFVAFASGALLSASFLHMIPEAYGEIGEHAFSSVLAGIILFFIFEKFIHWHHCGKEECKVKPAAYLNLVADAFHNFIDGVIVSSAYIIDFHVGLVTTFAIVLHEIPQEFGDFSVLIHSGMSTRKALAFNFLCATTAILGAVLGYVFLSGLQYVIPYAVSVAAGGFIYIASADLMPELHKEKDLGKMLLQTASLLCGVFVLLLSFNALPHTHSGHEGEHSVEHVCLDNGGDWLADFDECEGLSESVCVSAGGVFEQCASACRHQTQAQICTLQCVPVCSFAK